MKTSRIFWGVFLLTLGAGFLLERFGVLNLQWHHAWRYWPIVLIAWGAAILFGGKAIRLIAVIIAAAVLALVLVALFSFSWGDDTWRDGVMSQHQEFQEPYIPGSTHAAFALESGAGLFTLQDTTADFVAAKTTTSFGTYRLDRDSGANGVEYALRLDGAQHHWPPGRMRNMADVRLNSAPVWHLTMDVGAARMRCDVSAFKVEELKVDCGAADIELRLGERVPESHIKIDAGASSLKIKVPETAGCDVRIDAPLSGKTLPKFLRLGKGHYQSDNFENAGHHIYIDVDAGVSSINIDRY